MPGISAVKTGIPFSKKGFNFSSYWNTREPSGVVAEITSDTSATVTWNDSVETGADGYKVYADAVLKATVAVGVQTANITGLTANTSYVFKVVAYKGAEESTGDTDTQTTLDIYLDYDFVQGVDPDVLYDKSYNARNGAILRTSNKPAFVSGGIDYDAGSGYCTGAALNLTDRTWYFAFKWEAAKGAWGVMLIGAADANPPLMSIWSSSFAKYLYSNSGNYNSTGLNSANILNDNKWHIWVVCQSATSDYYAHYIDGICLCYETGISTNPISVAGIKIGYYALYYPSIIGEIKIYPTYHNYKSVITITKSIRNTLIGRGETVDAMPQTSNAHIVVTGDSFLHNIAALDNVAHISIRDVFGNMQYSSFARSGRTIKSTISEFTIQGPMAINAEVDKNILFIWAYANSSGGVAAITEYQTLAANARAMGYTHIIVGTALGKNGDAVYNTARNAHNVALLADDSWYDAIADFASDATIGTDNALADPTYSTDGWHPLNPAHLLMKPYLVAAINEVLAM